jgi:hypothetical protein
MKRYRIFGFDFDARALQLIPEQESWEEEIKKKHQETKQKIVNQLEAQYGLISNDVKIYNFIELGAKPFSILAFHNQFLRQIRDAFIMGGYYPALTGACALGERILNHLILQLRDFYKDREEYKKVYKQKSFDNWMLVIKTLEKWNVLLTEVAQDFEELYEIRNYSLHFNLEVENDVRSKSLTAVQLLQKIIGNQFSGAGKQPWLFVSEGEIYIKKEWENHPFIEIVYIPNCRYLGFKHEIKGKYPKFEINDEFEYSNQLLTDAEYVKHRRNHFSC